MDVKFALGDRGAYFFCVLSLNAVSSIFIYSFLSS